MNLTVTQKPHADIWNSMRFSLNSIEPPNQLIWWVSGATPVQLGWKGWKLSSLWIVSWQLHWQDRRSFPPNTGWTPPTRNSKSGVYPERRRSRSRRAPIELRVCGGDIITRGEQSSNSQRWNSGLKLTSPSLMVGLMGKTHSWWPWKFGREGCFAGPRDFGQVREEAKRAARTGEGNDRFSRCCA